MPNDYQPCSRLASVFSIKNKKDASVAFFILFQDEKDKWFWIW